MAQSKCERSDCQLDINVSTGDYYIVTEYGMFMCRLCRNIYEVLQEKAEAQTDQENEEMWNKFFDVSEEDYEENTE